MIRTFGAAAVAALALLVPACGSDAAPEATTESSASSASSSTSTAAATSAPPSSAQAPTPDMTLTEYFASAGITVTPVTRATPDAPVVDFPVTAGWTDGTAPPPDAYRLLTSTEPAPEPATATFLLDRLAGGDVSGNDLTAKIFEYASNEQRRLPEFQDLSSNEKGTLSGFPSMDSGGTYVKDGVTHLVGQKTVVFPAKDGDGTFLLRIVVDASEDQFGALADLTTDIDEKTTITP